MRKCLKCDAQVPNYAWVEGKKRNLNNRKYCLECSPFGKHNTRKIHDPLLANTPIYECRFCKKNYNGGHGKSKGICASCRVSNSRKNKKLDLIIYKGGKCIICKYDKCQQVLQFHHINPNEKEFTIASSGTLDFEKLKIEADKCILVCANCHGEIHAGLININDFIVQNTNCI
jgi:hypothetical protein